jgi:hypothetical protein
MALVWNHWDNLSADFQNMVSQRIQNRLVAMGQSGRHKLYDHDVRAAIEEEIAQFQLFQAYQTQATANRLLMQYPENLTISEAENATQSIRDRIFQAYQGGSILTDWVVKQIVETCVTPFLEQKKAERISALQEQVTEQRLIQYSLEHVDRQYPLKGLPLSDLVHEIQTAIESEYHRQDELRQDQVDMIYQGRIRKFIQASRDILAEKQRNDTEVQKKRLLEKDFPKNLSTIVQNYCRNFFMDGYQQEYFTHLIQHMVGHANAYVFHTQNQLSTLITLATGCLLFAAPFQIPGAKQVERHKLEQMVLAVHANFDQYNRNPGRSAETPLLDTADLIHQAVTLAGHLAETCHIFVATDMQNLEQVLVGKIP